jgi:hypothetical protein
MRILTTLFFSFCACVLFAAPQITLNQAYLADADAIVGIDFTGITEDHFLVKLCKQANDQVLAEAGVDSTEKFDFDLMKNAKGILTLKVRNIVDEKREFDPAKDFEMAGVFVYQNSIEELTRKQFNACKNAKKAPADVTLAMGESKYLDLPCFDVAITDEDGKTMSLRYILSADGKNIILGTKDAVNANIISAGAIPAALAEIQKSMPAKANLYIALPITEKIRSAAKEEFADEEDASVASEIDKLKFVGLAATCNTPNTIALKLVVGTVSADAAAGLGVQAQGFLPMIQMMGGDDPSLAWLKTVTMAVEGNNIVINASITEAQLNALIADLSADNEMPINE